MLERVEAQGLHMHLDKALNGVAKLLDLVQHEGFMLKEIGIHLFVCKGAIWRVEVFDDDNFKVNSLFCKICLDSLEHFGMRHARCGDAKATFVFRTASKKAKE